VGVDRTTVVPDAGRNGHTLYDHTDIEWDAPERMQLLRADCALMAVWAGVLAEERFTGIYNDDGARDDLAFLDEKTLLVVGNDAEKARKYKRMLRFLTRTALAEPKLVAWVPAVAERLLDRGELTGDEVDELEPPD